MTWGFSAWGVDPWGFGDPGTPDVPLVCPVAQVGLVSAPVATIACGEESMNQITIFRGDDRTLSALVQDQGAPVDLAGASVTFTARRVDGTRAVVLDYSTANGGVVLVDAAAGQCAILISGADTANAGCGTFLYDLQLVTSGGKTHTTIIGVLNVLEDVTI